MWETTKNLIRGPTEFQGRFVVPKPILDAIKTHAAETPNKETGGMLFGQIEETRGDLDIVVEVVHNIKENKASNTSTYFGIETKYATKVLHTYEPDHLYLGNWHSHLGYGGPSSGDRQEVGKYFSENSAREVTLDFIMDRQSRTGTQLKYKPIIDVYRRKGNHDSEYRTFRVGQEGLEIPEMDEDSVIISNSKESKIDEKDTDTTDSTGPDIDHTDDLIKFVCEHFSIENEDIRTYWNEPYSETVALIPFSYEHKRRNEPLEVMLKVSFPDDPSDEVFVDLTSFTLEKQITIMKIPTNKIKDSRDNLTNQIESIVNKKIPVLLNQPLASVLSDIDNDNSNQDTEWELCQN